MDDFDDYKPPVRWRGQVFPETTPPTLPLPSWRDRVTGKGKAKGVEHYSAKLDPDKVREIRVSDLSNAALAKKFGVRQNAIWKVRKRISWKHVP